MHEARSWRLFPDHCITSGKAGVGSAMTSQNTLCKAFVAVLELVVNANVCTKDEPTHFRQYSQLMGGEICRRFADWAVASNCTFNVVKASSMEILAKSTAFPVPGAGAAVDGASSFPSFFSPALI